MQTRSRRLLTVLALLCGTSLVASDKTAIALGTWTGTSICVGDRPACKNETVVYRVLPIEGQPAKVRLFADKIIEGKRLPMGAFDFDLNGPRLSAEFTRGNTHAIWEFTIDGDTMQGGLYILPKRDQGRRVNVHRVTADKVPPAPPLKDYEE